MKQKKRNDKLCEFAVVRCKFSFSNLTAQYLLLSLMACLLIITNFLTIDDDNYHTIKIDIFYYRS